MKLTLQWSGEQGTKTYTLVQEKDAWIGRNPSCRFHLNHPTVSRQHALIRQHDRAFYIQNHSSRQNSMRINGAVIETKQYQKLNNGDLVELGGCVLRVSILHSPTSPDTHLVECSNCRRPVSLSESNCPHCGQNLASAVTHEFK